jgi:hypothetical protein
VAVVAIVAAAGCARARVPTNNDVAPIFARHCVRCHGAAGLAAFPRLDDTAALSRHAARIARVVAQREMPPWGIDSSGLCSRWQDALWLTEEEIATVVAWAEHGATRSRAAATAPVPPRDKLDRVDAVLDMGVAYQPGVGRGAYRCFVVDPGLARDRRLTAFAVASSDARPVAQVTLYALDSAAADREAAELDAREPGPGYSCYGAARVAPARLVGSWTWGSGVARLPPGLGLTLAAGRKMILQIHYNVTNAGLSAQSRTHIDLELDDNAREAWFWNVTSRNFTLPPGRAYAEIAGEATAPAALMVYGVVPRMHTLGRTLEVDLIGHPARHSLAGDDSARTARLADRLIGDGTRCLANVDHWDVYWQRLYLLAAPLPLDARAPVRVTCSYDTQSRGEAVTAGERIEDEACAAELLVAPR